MLGIFGLGITIQPSSRNHNCECTHESKTTINYTSSYQGNVTDSHHHGYHSQPPQQIHYQKQEPAYHQQHQQNSISLQQLLYVLIFALLAAAFWSYQMESARKTGNLEGENKQLERSNEFYKGKTQDAIYIKPTN